MICMKPIWIILRLLHEQYAPFHQWSNLWNPQLPSSRLPSRSNDGAPVLATRIQPSICPHCPVPIVSTQPINTAKPDPPIHFQTNKPSAVSKFCIFHQITCPSKPFLNLNDKTVFQPHHYSTYYLPLHAIFEWTLQTLWADPDFFIILPDPPSHLWTDMPSPVIQYFYFLIILPVPPSQFWNSTPRALSHYLANRCDPRSVSQVI